MDCLCAFNDAIFSLHRSAICPSNVSLYSLSSSQQNNVRTSFIPTPPSHTHTHTHLHPTPFAFIIIRSISCVHWTVNHLSRTFSLKALNLNQSCRSDRQSLAEWLPFNNHFAYALNVYLIMHTVRYVKCQTNNDIVQWFELKFIVYIWFASTNQNVNRGYRFHNNITFICEKNFAQFKTV